jgi:hypothetical protein
MTFRDEFFIALNQWQKGWAEDQDTKNEFSISLKQECCLIDNKYKVIEGPCYRKRFIHRGELVDIILNDNKTEGVTSWTSDVRYAEFFKGKFRESAVSAAIFEHTPTDGQVIVNVNELWKCADFIKGLDDFKKRNPEQCDAIYHFKDTQKEVILEVPLRGSEICILSGKSSSFDDICDSVNVPEADRPRLFKQLIDGGAFIEEVTYVKDAAARNAVRNTVRKFYEMLENLNKQ